MKLFDDREKTIANGIILFNEQYDVHRFHPPLIYGRKGDSAKGQGEGIAICKVRHVKFPSMVSKVNRKMYREKIRKTAQPFIA